MFGTTRALPWALAAAAWALPLAAQPPAPDPVAELRAEIAQLRQDYERRLSELEARLAAVEATPETPPAAAAPEPSAADELARLRDAARAAATSAATPSVAPADAGGRGRSLNRLNPEISFTADLRAVADDRQRDEFVVKELELDLQAALDPYSRMRFTLSFGDDGVIEPEEIYILYSSLPGGLSLHAGRFRQTFGALNRQHLHALPQSDYPLPLTAFFGDEGLAQTGISLEWLLPKSWATASELTFQVTDGENEAFGGESFEQLAYLAHLKSFWELSDAAYFEWGLSGAAGETADGGDSRVWGSDFTYHWRPPLRAKFREITWRTEVLLSQRDAPGGLGPGLDAWGGYSYLEGLIAQNLYLGLRYDQAEDPLAPGHRSRAIVPYLTWWQSEFVRLRAEYRRLEDDFADATDNRFALQLVWAAGPHKHETY
jgi:hypothetical protein